MEQKATKKTECEEFWKTIAEALNGHELTADEINRIAKNAEAECGLSAEASDMLKLFLLSTTRVFKDYAFRATYKPGNK